MSSACPPACTTAAQLLCPSPSDQHLELTKGRSSEEIAVKGHVVISLTCSDRQSSVTTLLAHSAADQLPEG